MKQPPYQIEFTEQADEQVKKRLSTPERALLFDGVGRQLSHQPEVETRNRKPMRPNPIAPWELRIRHLRVYYEPKASERIVTVRAVGIKCGNKVLIGDEWWEFEQPKHKEPRDEDPGA